MTHITFRSIANDPPITGEDVMNESPIIKDYIIYRDDGAWLGREEARSAEAAKAQYLASPLNNYHHCPEHVTAVLNPFVGS